MPALLSAMNPSTSSPRSIVIPSPSIRTTTPDDSTSGANRSTRAGQGSSVSCFNPKEIRLFSGSTSPSIPFSISTNAPNEVRCLTVPPRVVPVGYFAGNANHGSSSICFIPREIFSSSGSTRRTTPSINALISTTLEGCLIFRVHDISEICTRPSTPRSSSMKAP